MPIAIHTKYFGATNTRGSRVKASVFRDQFTTWSVSVPYHDSDNPHLSAAQALAEKYWPGTSVRYVGSSIDGRGDVYSLDN